MHLAADYITPTPHGGYCRVRIYEPGEARNNPVAVLTELDSNPGMSITNSAERLAAEISAAHGLDPGRMVWIEHYENDARGTPEDPHTFDLVLFASYEIENLGSYLGEERKRIGKPSWKALDRATAEALVGEAL